MNEWRPVGRPATLAQVEGDIPDVHVIAVRERRVTVDYPTIIQNNVNTDTIELDLDGEWDGMSVVLVLGPCGGATELAWHGEPLTLPSALAEDTGGIDVSVVGYSADGETRLVTVAAPSLLNVIKSGCTVGEAPGNETPDLIGQLVAAGDAANKAAQSANAAAEAAGAAAEAARGNVLKGTLGPAPVLSADDAYATKPRRLTVYGATRQNLWVNPSGTINGITVTSNKDGSMTLSGTATSAASVSSADSYIIKPSTAYTLSMNAALTGASFVVTEYDADGSQLAQHNASSTSAASFTSSASVARCVMSLSVQSGQTVSGTYRVMLNEGSTAEPWCPPGLNSVGDGGNVKIVTAGKNLWASKAFTDGGITAVVNDDGSVTLDGTSTSSGFANKSTVTGFLPPGKYTLSVDRTADENASFFVRAVVYGTEKTLATIRALSKTFTIPVGTSSVICGVQVVKGNEVHGTFRVQLELGSTATDYEPPTVTTTPIDLDGHTLNSLPDGTHDELTIDATGAVTLTKRVGDVSVASGTALTYINEDNHCFNATITSGAGTTDYELATPLTIELPPVTLPALPAPTVNVWADAESSGTGYAMGPDGGMEYERDVTIAFDKLQAQVSATTVREATNG